MLPALLFPALSDLLSVSPFFSLPRRQEQFQTNPDSYNGAVRENYAWSQDYSDLEIKVPVPKHIVKGKQVKRLGRFVLQYLPVPWVPSCLRSRAWSGEAPQPPARPSDRGAGRGRAWFPLFSAPAGFLGAAGPFLCLFLPFHLLRARAQVSEPCLLLLLPATHTRWGSPSPRAPQLLWLCEEPGGRAPLAPERAQALGLNSGDFPSAPLPAADLVFFHLGSPRCPTSRSLLAGQLQ